MKSEAFIQIESLIRFNKGRTFYKVSTSIYNNPEFNITNQKHKQIIVNATTIKIILFFITYFV